MININPQNVEELLFKNSEIKSLLSDLRHIFDKWLLSYRFPALNNMRKQAIIELLNSLNASHLEKLAKFLGDMILVNNLDNHIIKNFKIPVDAPIPIELTKHGSYDNIVVSRDANDVYITIWR